MALGELSLRRFGEQYLAVGGHGGLLRVRFCVAGEPIPGGVPAHPGMPLDPVHP